MLLPHLQKQYTFSVLQPCKKEKAKTASWYSFWELKYGTFYPGYLILLLAGFIISITQHALLVWWSVWSVAMKEADVSDTKSTYVRLTFSWDMSQIISRHAPSTSISPVVPLVCNNSLKSTWDISCKEARLGLRVKWRIPPEMLDFSLYALVI